MKYDFDKIIDRKNTDAWAIRGLGKYPDFSPDPPEEGFDVIPMWVADMSFETCPSITAEIIERAKHPLYGYFLTLDEYYNSIISWHKTRNHTEDLKRENIGDENGVLGGVVSAVNVFSQKGDNILIHSPTYIGFTNCLENNGYKLILSPLKLDENNIWRMDYEDMEKKIKEKKIHTAVFCSPHNPTGRVWEKEELTKAFEIFEKYEVNVVSDEIWSDLLLFGNKHITLQSVSPYAKKHTVALYAPSKTFNTSGIVGAYHIIYDKVTKEKVEKESSLCHYNDLNVFSMYNVIGAYKKEGHEWTDQLKEVLSANAKYAVDFIKNHFKGVNAPCPQGTYMLFVDCTEWCKEHNKTIEEVEKSCWRVGVAIQDGKMFHGPCHIRMNLALPMAKLKEAFDRMDKYVFNAK